MISYLLRNEKVQIKRGSCYAFVKLGWLELRDNRGTAHHWLRGEMAVPKPWGRQDDTHALEDVIEDMIRGQSAPENGNAADQGNPIICPSCHVMVSTEVNPGFDRCWVCGEELDV